MEFEWDETKNRLNILKHGFDFADAREVFHGPFIARADPREDYEEERSIGIGLLGYRVVAIAFTERANDVIRIISFRKADQDERKEFEKAFQNRLGKN